MAYFKIRPVGKVGLPLPKLWVYKQDDTSTWPYLDCVIGGQDKAPSIVRWVMNPKFKHPHLIQRK